MQTTECPNCHARVVPMQDGDCPSCRTYIFQPDCLAKTSEAEHDDQLANTGNAPTQQDTGIEPSGKRSTSTTTTNVESFTPIILRLSVNKLSTFDLDSTEGIIVRLFPSKILSKAAFSEWFVIPILIIAMSFFGLFDGMVLLYSVLFGIIVSAVGLYPSSVIYKMKTK